MLLLGLLLTHPGTLAGRNGRKEDRARGRARLPWGNRIYLRSIWGMYGIRVGTVGIEHHTVVSSIRACDGYDHSWIMMKNS